MNGSERSLIFHLGRRRRRRRSIVETRMKLVIRPNCILRFFYVFRISIVGITHFFLITFPYFRRKLKISFLRRFVVSNFSIKFVETVLSLEKETRSSIRNGLITREFFFSIRIYPTGGCFTYFGPRRNGIMG